MQPELNIRVDDKNAEKILNRVNKSNPSREDMEAFRALVAEKPREYAEMGAICLNARDIYLNALNGIERECIKLKLREIEDAITTPSDGEMEKLLVGHVVLTYLRLMMIERQYTVVTEQSHTLTLGAYWEKRLSAAQKRFTRATENLARVRKLLKPTINVLAINNASQRSDATDRRFARRPQR